MALAHPGAMARTPDGALGAGRTKGLHAQLSLNSAQRRSEPKARWNMAGVAHHRLRLHLGRAPMYTPRRLLGHEV
eukprot:94076-Pyramimonas_sp.AAC.1